MAGESKVKCVDDSGFRNNRDVSIIQGGVYLSIVLRFLFSFYIARLTPRSCTELTSHHPSWMSYA